MSRYDIEREVRFQREPYPALAKKVHAQAGCIGGIAVWMLILTVALLYMAFFR